jgi:hypothetical protein
MENKKLTYLGSVDCCLGDSISLELKNGNMFKFILSDDVVNNNPDLFKFVEDKTEIEYLNVSDDIIKLRKHFKTFSEFWKSCSNDQIIEIAKSLGFEDDVNTVYSIHNEYKDEMYNDCIKYCKYVIDNLNESKIKIDSMVTDKFSSVLRDRLTDKITNALSASDVDKCDKCDCINTELKSNDNPINYMDEYYESLGLSKSDIEKIQNNFFKIKNNL